jgi:membrane protease YdiL (CAAX protease family)
LAKVIRITDKRVVKVFDPEPWKDAGINCGVYFVVMLITVILDRLYPFTTKLTCMLVVVPYLLILAFVLGRRFMQRPEFPMGSPVGAISSFAMVWAGIFFISIFFAYNNGLFSPLTLVGKLKHFGTILEEPVAQELLFRGALLTSLQQTQLGQLAEFRAEACALAGAVIFAVLHAIIFAVAGFSFADVVMTGVTAFLLSSVYGWIYLKTENVWYGVFLHMLINFGRWG